MFWTLERVNALVELWLVRGRSFGEIARALGTTRNAIAGKTMRLRNLKESIGTDQIMDAIARKQEEIEQKRMIAERRRQETKLSRRCEREMIRASNLKERMERRKAAALFRRLARKQARKEKSDAFESKGVTLLNRRMDECAYVVGPQTMCGNQVCYRADQYKNVLPTNWCKYHYDLTHIPTKR